MLLRAARMFKSLIFLYVLLVFTFISIKASSLHSNSRQRNQNLEKIQHVRMCIRIHTRVICSVKFLKAQELPEKIENISKNIKSAINIKNVSHSEVTELEENINVFVSRNPVEKLEVKEKKYSAETNINDKIHSNSRKRNQNLAKTHHGRNSFEKLEVKQKKYVAEAKNGSTNHKNSSVVPAIIVATVFISKMI